MVHIVLKKSNNMRLKVSEKIGKKLGISHSVCTQNFPKNYYFLPTDSHVYLSGVKMLFFGIFCVHTKWMIPYNAAEFLDYISTETSYCLEEI